MTNETPSLMDFLVRRRAIGLLVGLALTGCGGNKQSEAAPSSNWVRDCPGDAFCFTRPGTLVAQPGQIIDSLAARYRDSAMTLTFDLGRYGTSVDHLISPTKEDVTIDGRPAQLLLTERELVLVVPRVHVIGKVVVRFNMALKFEGKASRELALRIFQSIQFKPPR